jgi:serine/threonine-protein kinase
MTDVDPTTESLHRLGVLVDAAGGDAAPAETRSPIDPETVTELVRAGRLTAFQARQVVRGRGHHLLVGPYVLLDRVGRGGMGQVFRARHRHLGRLAAVKLAYPARHDCPDTRRRLLREIALVGRMNHPHVVHALDAGEIRGTYYLAFEYVPGPDLGRVVRADGPLAPAHACEYARQAALGLAHVHARGVVHRDVKPANLGLANGEREVKVLDFGLAAPVRRRASKGIRRFLGSADFVAPEQVADPAMASARSDVYGLGATLYYLLTGQVPFPGGGSLDKAKRHQIETPRPVEELRPDLPPVLAELVRKLMARSPRLRVASAADAVAELTRFASPIVAPVWAAKLDAASSPTVIDIPTLAVRV